MVYTIDQIKEKIVTIAKQYDLSKIYLFGSYARGKGSDLWSQKASTKLKTAFEKIWCGFLGLRYVTRWIDCYELESVKKWWKSLLFSWIWYVVKDYFWSVKSINSKI